MKTLKCLRSTLGVLLGVCLIASTKAAEPLSTLQVAAGDSHALALRSDGTVWAWGTNRIGELGLGSATQFNSPRRITTLSNMTAVAAGPLHSLAVASNGQAWAWGTNGSGQLGNGTFNNSNAPVQVSVITNALLVSAGVDHSLAALKDGRAMAWGANNGGQLGTGNTTATNQPVQVSTLTNTIAVAAGSNFSMALTAAGEVWTWGTNDQGQLGLGHNTSQLSPVKIAALSNVVQIVAGSSHALAMDRSGNVYAWGRNTEGQMGDGTTTATNAPKPVVNLSPTGSLGAAKWIAAGFNSSAAVSGSGKVCYWGNYTNNAVFFGNATSPVQIGVALNETFTTVCQGRNFLLAGESDGAGVWAWGMNQYGQWGNDNPQTDDWRYETWNLSYCFGARPRAFTVRIHRGDRENLPYNSFVLPLDLEQGVRLNAEGSDQYCYGAGAPWFMRVQKATRQQVWKLVGATTNVTRFPVENPLAAYGREAGGSPLYTGQPYTFGVYAGAFNENTGQTNAIRVLVYERAALAAGTNNVAPANAFNISLPRRYITADNTVWSNFVTNGNRVLVETNGLRTVVEFADAPDSYNNWGVYLNAAAPNVVMGGYRVTHTATSTNYCYLVEVQGQAEVGANVFAPMATTNTTDWAYLPMYAVGFEQFPEWRSRLVDNPHYEGIPLPPAYAGRRLAELNGMTAAATNTFWLTNNTAYATNDASPELRRHPVLDRFVEDMGRNPLALASYVLNEIELTDPMAIAESSTRVADSIEVGGVNRSALGTFLEGQGSPTEQCALLVYLLRQAGYSAGYVFPTNSNLRLLDTTVSRLWQINVKGVVYHAGVPVITNSLITVNYPWVVANIGTNCVHIFPWLKDTEIVEGPDIYDYMPTNYPNAYRWVKDYVQAKPEVLGTALVNEPTIKAWKQFLTGVLNTNQTGNLSLDDFGVRAFNRRNSYSAWEQLPKPNFLTNQTQLVTVPTLSESATTYPFLTNMFDRVRIEVFKTDTNTANRIFDTGLWRACDLHNRKLLLYTNDATTANLWLAPYRVDATNSTGNFAGFEAGLGSLDKQVVQATVASGVTVLPIRVTYQRRVVTYPSPATWYAMQEFGLQSYDLIAEKRNMTAICSSVGRVTPLMLRMHADDYWRVEQQRALNPNSTPAVTDVAGTAATMLGMGFFERMWTDDQINRQLHQVKGLTWASWGTAALTPLANDGMVVRLDMRWLQTLLLGNGRLRQDSGDRSSFTLDNYLTMLQANGSSAEHTIMASMLKDREPLSAIRLLQIAGERARTNGWAAPLELNVKNYLTLGETTQTGYGSTKLKEHQPGLWQSVTNTFSTNSTASFLRVLITPGNITNSTGNFVGMSALLFGKWQNGAILAADDTLLNGGWSSWSAWFGTPTFSSYQLNYNLQYSSTFGYSYVPNNFSTPLPRYDFSQYDLLTLTAPTGAALVAFTPQQVARSQIITNTLNLPSGTTTAQATKTAKDVGWYDRATALMKQAGAWLADPVHVVSGDFYVDAADLTLAGPLPLQLRRTYLSRTLAENQFGHGWKLGFTPWLVLSTNAQSQSLIHAAEPDGAVLAYRFQSNDVWTVTAEDNPTLVNFTGAGIGATANHFHNRIEKYSTNGTTYVLTATDGSKRSYQEMTGFGLNSGTNYLNRVRPYLTRWEDHSGNYHQFQYGTNSADTDFGQLYRVESANGATLTFKYDVNGRITEAMTDDDRHVRYQYDVYGDLVLVTLPDSSQWEYEYEHYTFTTNSVTYTDSNHLLVREVKPDGRILANTYDSLRRVMVQAATVGTNRELVTNAWFYYTNNCNSLTNEYLTGTTRVEDVFHNAYLYQYTNNLITRIDEPLGRTNIQDWFEAGETNKAGYYARSLELTVNARGLTNEFRYDAQGNITNRIVRGNLTGEGVSNQSATNTFTYNTNKLLLTAVDPSGNQRAFFYEDSGDPYRASRIEWSSGGSGISTNRFTYTNVTETVSVGTLSKTNRAFGLLARAVHADTATNDWTYYGRGFVAQSTRYARTAEDTGNNDPAVVNTFIYTPRGDLAERVDAAGRRARFSHDSMGRLQWREVVDETGTALAREHFYYNRNGDLEWYDGPRSGPEDYVWFDYDGAGRKVQELSWRSRAKADGSGVEAEPGDNLYATTNFRYDAFGNLTLMVDARGAITTNVWDALGRLVQQKSFDLNGTSVLATVGFAYAPDGLVRYHTNALSGVSEIQYTSEGQPNSRLNADGSTNGWTYYLDGRRKRAIQSNGAYWESTYTDASRRVTQVFYSAAGTPLATNITEFDRRGNVVIQIDEAGFGSTNRFDGLGRMKSWAGPKMVYVLPEGSPSSPASDPPPIQQVFTNFYDAAGIATTNVNALSEKSISYRDALGRLTRAEVRTSANVLVRETTAAYTADHHGVTVTQGSGASAIVSTTYTDTAGRNVLALMYPASGVQHFTLNSYDAAGNLSATAQYARTNATQTLFTSASFSYDGLNRLTQQADRDSAVTTYQYDAAGNRVQQVVPGGLIWQAAYNNAGLMFTNWNASPGGSVLRANGYTYYGSGHQWAGRLLSHTDARGVVCTNYYDDWLRVVTNAYTGSLAEQQLTTTWQYDVRGLMTNAVEAFASTNTGLATSFQRSYNAYGQLTSESTIFGTNGNASGNAYDSAGRRTILGMKTFGYGFAWRADGQLAGVHTLTGDTAYTYDTAGRLTNRVSGVRSTAITARDGTGRPLALETKISGVTKLTESLSYTGDGLMATHTMARTDFTDSRRFSYANQSRRLAQEQLNMDGSTTWTNVFTFDSGSAAGAGVLTRIAQTATGGAEWNAHMDAHLRVDRETNNVVRRLAYGRVNMQPGYAQLGIALNGRPVPFLTLGNGDTNWPTRWQAQLELLPGTHTLTATAVHPSKLYTNTSTTTFTNQAVDQTVLTYYSEGQLTQRVWKNSGGQTNRTQNFKWDAKGRLLNFTERDVNNDGHDWTAVYDALGRRWQAKTVPITNNVSVTSQLKVVTQLYDPLVEFLEVGVRVDERWHWKVYGPDLDGVYGGMNGVGGWEAVVSGPDTYHTLISDARGNIVAAHDPEDSSIHWNAARITGYGSVAEHRPLSLGEGAPMWEAGSWRGRFPEMSGLYNLGARYYDPVAGRFLSPDPLGHDSDPSLYGAFNGDPINYFDADGRFGKTYAQNKVTDTAAGFKGTELAIIGVFQGLPHLADMAIQAHAPPGTMQLARTFGFDPSVARHFDPVFNGITENFSQSFDQLAGEAGVNTLSDRYTYGTYGAKTLVEIGSLFIGAGEAKAASTGIQSLERAATGMKPPPLPPVVKPPPLPAQAIEAAPKAVSLRNQYLGRTPGKGSRTGREVIERMQAEGDLRLVGGKAEVRYIDPTTKAESWHPINTADMGHLTDAVKYWNAIGRFLGPKHPEVRKWMLDPANYKLEPGSINRANGAKLRERYLPPANGEQ